MSIDDSPNMSACRLHPLLPLSKEEIVSAVAILRQQVSKRMKIEPYVIRIHTVALREPVKASLVAYLAAEHAGIPPSSRMVIPRLADVVFAVRKPYTSCQSVVCLDSHLEVSHLEAEQGQHGSLDEDEMNHAIELVRDELAWQEALQSLNLDPRIALEYEVWPYGSDHDMNKDSGRLMRIYCYSRAPNNHPDSNVYARPLPLAAVFSVPEQKMVRLDRLSTDGVPTTTLQPGAVFLNRAEDALEYTPDMNARLRPRLKPISITQPHGVDFTVEDKSLVKWQKWQFRVGFNPREGLIIHDVRYDSRSLFHRLSISEMTVPYGDPRPPYHLKQAFDIGDSGAGVCANSLDENCDCLGSVYYFDTWAVDEHGNGNPYHKPHVVCMHEQDDGIGWRHFNGLSGYTVSVRSRLLVLQMTMTLGNYDYILAWHFNQAAEISFELRATGIVATQRIDANCVSPWGTVVAPDVLAPNHQHFTCVRMDPAIDGQANSIFQYETIPLAPTDDRNLHGNGWQGVLQCVTHSSYADASPLTNRCFLIANERLVNPISHRPIAYKLEPIPSALLLAHPDSATSRRAKFARHHVWITRHRDDALYAGGQWTTQSLEETGGVADEARRAEGTRNTDVVLWHTFSMTHSPRVEDFPVMPVERLKFTLKPVDFFHANPALDIPPHVRKVQGGPEM